MSPVLLSNTLHAGPTCAHMKPALCHAAAPYPRYTSTQDQRLQKHTFLQACKNEERANLTMTTSHIYCIILNNQSLPVLNREAPTCVRQN